MALYSSVGLLAFTLQHDSSDPTDTPVNQIRAALMRRIADLDESEEWVEALAFDDTAHEE